MVFPVLISSAPVGSSHKSILGFFASALAMATLCCSPPDNCDGKFPILSDNPTASIVLTISRGSLHICVASSTFSLTVRFCTRL